MNNNSSNQFVFLDTQNAPYCAVDLAIVKYARVVGNSEDGKKLAITFNDGDAINVPLFSDESAVEFFESLVSTFIIS